MSFLYPFHVNKALAQMNVSPTRLRGARRSDMQQLAKAAGLTPQEAAIIIVVAAFENSPPMEVSVPLEDWKREGKEDIQKAEVYDALRMMFTLSELAEVYK